MQLTIYNSIAEVRRPTPGRLLDQLSTVLKHAKCRSDNEYG